jgi:hypothetical protein
MEQDMSTEQRIWMVFQVVEDHFGRDASVLLGLYSTEARAQASKTALEKDLADLDIEGVLEVHYTTLNYRGWQGGFFSGIPE